MTVTNPPLAPWQIEHIRKMQEELGLPQSAPDTEEVTMDEELDSQAPADDTVGGLSVYGDADVKAAMAVEKKLANEREAYYDKIAKALEEKRYGPSFSERMFQLSAAFAAPTSTRGFSGVMGNVMPVLAAQQKARREGEISRREALEQLEANRLTNKLGLARQDTQTKIALAKLAKQGTGPGQWSERFGRFIPKDRPVPVKSGVLGGRRIVTLSDGMSKLYGFGGDPKAYEILDAAGNVIGQETE